MNATPNSELVTPNRANACVLAIAGFDPSGGAGILADIKTFEANNVCGMGAITAVTFQNDSEFDDVKWIEADEILKQVSVLKRKFEFPIVKIGLIKNLEILQIIVEKLTAGCQPQTANCRLIWDPIITATAGFQFHKKFEKEKLISVLKNIYLITPNTEEIKFLSGMNNPHEGARALSVYCNVLLKGGHNNEEPGVDYLFSDKKIEKILPGKSEIFPKHGSGCVLSSAIAANLAKGKDLITSCREGKNYVEEFLSGNPTLLGIHHVQ